MLLAEFPVTIVDHLTQHADQTARSQTNARFRNPLPDERPPHRHSQTAIR